MRMLKQQGFTLIEVIIALGLMGLLTLVVSSMLVSSNKNLGEMKHSAQNAKAFVLIEADITSIALNLISQEGTNVMDAYMNETQLDQTFNSRQLTVFKRCYNDEIASINCNNANLVKYTVDYYKFRLEDKRFQRAELRKLPMSRVNVRITYQDEQKQTVKKYISRLVTHNLYY